MRFFEMLVIGGLSLSCAVMLIEFIIAACRWGLNQRAAAAYRRYHSRSGVDD